LELDGGQWLNSPCTCFSSGIE